jgi:hypothetical protein
MDGQYQNAITSLPSLNTLRYERIFKLFTTEQNQYYYNLLQSIYISDDIDDTKIFNLTVKQNLPWTAISYNVYGNIELWWLILLVNKIYNPIKEPAQGMVLKLIKPEFVPDILREISNSLN